MECEADKLVLRYRYTLDELALLLQGKKNYLKDLNIMTFSHPLGGIKGDF